MQPEAIQYERALLVRDGGGFSPFLFILMFLQVYFRLKAEISGLLERIRVLEEANRKLYEEAHLGCDTSGIPSGKDWKKSGDSQPVETEPDDTGGGSRETPTSITGYLKNRGGEKRQPGGQKGHPPAFMQIDDAQEGEPVFHYPDNCTRCPHMGQCIKEGKFRKYSTSHGYDIKVIKIHRVHFLFEATGCPQSGTAIRDDFPEVIGTQYYEMGVQIHVLTWHHVFHGSYERIGLAAKELFGLSLSAGTAAAIIQRAAASILGSGFMDALRFFILLFEQVLGVDETSARVSGRNAWVHTSVTRNVTLLTAHWRRGYEGATYTGLLQFFTCTLISDCWAAYFSEKLKCRHAICDGHILRELVAAAYFRHQSWAIEMFDLLLEVFSAKADAVEQKGKCLPQDYINDIKARYRQIVADGFIEIGGETKGKTFSLLDRLRKLEDAALAFAADFTVDFSNNASEISLRNLKVVLRVIGQFKTMSGLGDYCVIQSFMDTCRKQGHNPFNMMRVILSGGDIIEAVFGAEKAALLKQMIGLTDVIAAGDAAVINAAVAGIPILLTDELLAAASHGHYKICDDPPPGKQNSSPAVPKDKMQAARERNNLKSLSKTPAAVLPGMNQGSTADSHGGRDPPSSPSQKSA